MQGCLGWEQSAASLRAQDAPTPACPQATAVVAVPHRRAQGARWVQGDRALEAVQLARARTQNLRIGERSCRCGPGCFHFADHWLQRYAKSQRASGSRCQGQQLSETALGQVSARPRQPCRTPPVQNRATAPRRQPRGSWQIPLGITSQDGSPYTIMARASSARVEAQLILAIGYLPRCSLCRAHNGNDNDPNTKGPESLSHQLEEPTNFTDLHDVLIKGLVC